MNPLMLHTMAESRCREIRRDAAQHGGGAEHNVGALRRASLGVMPASRFRCSRMAR